MPTRHSSANAASVDPDPKSGIRLSDPDAEREDVSVDDFDVDGFAADDDDGGPKEEGSFFGASDDAATNRIFRIFARKSIDDGHGAIKAGHDRRYPDGHARKGGFYRDFNFGATR